MTDAALAMLTRLVLNHRTADLTAQERARLRAAITAVREYGARELSKSPSRYRAEDGMLSATDYRPTARSNSALLMRDRPLMLRALASP